MITSSRYENKKPEIEYNGETIGLLLFTIQRLGEVTKYDSNTPEGFGKIILKNNENSWISKRKAFYGWAIEKQKEKRDPSTYRWHRQDHLLELQRSAYRCV